jgi:hypothetical protein
MAYMPSAMYNTPVPMSGPGQQPPQQSPAGWRGLLQNQDLAMALLANSGYSPQKRSFGEIVGTSMMQAQGMKSQRDEDAFKRQYMQAQMRAMGGANRSPSSVQEYEYAKKNGYQGSFQDWTVAAGQSSRPSSVLEWEHYNGLMESDKKNGTQNARAYLEMKRNPNFKVSDIQGSPTVITGTPGGGVQTTPLSTPQAEIDAAARRKGAEAQAGAVGTGAGQVIADIQKKGANAQTINAVLDLADPLIDAATGSLVGAGADKLAGAFGKSLSGAEATAQLQVLQAGLMLNQPRMEGPQSDADVLLYRAAAGQIGDPTVPGGTKKAALKTIRLLQQKYISRASEVSNNTNGDPLGIR